MRCKPGDLAVIVNQNPDYFGMFVEVLHAAPAGDFRLPDGQRADGAGIGYWVLMSLGRPFKAPIAGGRYRLARYAVGGDSGLRPIRPGDGADETLTWAGKPEKAEA